MDRRRAPGRRRATTPAPRRRGERGALGAGPLRYDRLLAATVSLAITAVALLAGVGVIPIGARGERASADVRAPSGAVAEEAAVRTSTLHGGQPTARATELPADSGRGKRVVFSIDDQRVWLVGKGGRVVATYLVSGSLTDNLDPGSYEVFSRSRWAVGIDDSGVMQYFVRFAHGDNAAIGFHSIPTKNGEPLQSVAELGTPTSHGCIRQRMADAKRLWSFAPEGTSVVVTA